MRCVAYTPDRHAEDLRRSHMFVDLGASVDDLRASMAGLLHTAQAEGLLVDVTQRHSGGSYWELGGGQLQRLRRSGDPGAQAVDVRQLCRAVLNKGQPAEEVSWARRDCRAARGRIHRRRARPLLHEHHCQHADAPGQWK